MRRSNRLILLIGVFLTIIAFVAVLLIATGINQPRMEYVTGPSGERCLVYRENGDFDLVCDEVAP